MDVTDHPLAQVSEDNDISSNQPKQYPAHQFLRKSFPQKERLYVKDVTQDASGLFKLAKAGQWKEVLKLCEKLIAQNQLPQEDLIQVRVTQIMTLLRLKLYDYAAAQLTNIGDLNVLAKKIGKPIPYMITLYKALMPHFQGFTDQALDNLYILLHQCAEKIKQLDYESEPILAPTSNFQKVQATQIDAKKLRMKDSNASNIWKLREQRVIFFIINLHLAKQDFDLALNLLEKIHKKYPNDITLFSLLGCVYLQCGMINRAEEIFKQIEALVEDPENHVQCKLNRGYLEFGKGRYSAALDLFDSVAKDDPLNLIAANNKAICLLYTRNLVKAIDSLENVIRQDPLKTMDETLIFNLCTMYDLEAENSTEKKNVIRSLISQYASDDFPTTALKLV